MRLKEVHLAGLLKSSPSALGCFHCFLAEMHSVKTLLPGASPLVDTGQEDDEARQSVGICQLLLLEEMGQGAGEPVL